MSVGEYGRSYGMELLHDLQGVLHFVRVPVHEPPPAHVHAVVQEVLQVE